MHMTADLISQDYIHFLEDLKSKVSTSRYHAALSVNSEMILLYHHIGTQIIKSQEQYGWGAKVISQLSHNLRSTFPDMKGFSTTNLKYMKMFAEEYMHEEIGQQAVDQLPWGHIIALIHQVSDKNDRRFYIQQAIENGWSRNVLAIHIETKLHKRQGQTINNFKDTLPSPHSDLVRETFKDPYIFDFLSIEKDAHERDIEKAMTAQIQKLLLELGSGFAFVGNQYNINVGGDDYFIDMLFYHLKLRCYVVIELKSEKLSPKDVGQLNFYLAAIDGEIKHESDNPSIGLLLCKDKGNHITAEYSLRNMASPIGVASYIPKELEDMLPSIEQIESKLNRLL